MGVLETVFGNLEWYYKYDVNHGKFISTDMYPYYHILPWGSVILYYLTLVIIPKILKKGLKIDFIITLWNFFVWILSVLMFLGGSYGAYLLIKHDSFHYFMCSTEAVEQPNVMIFWTYMFALSKYLELFDTLWVLLKNPEKPVEFLHWWHHITVLLFTWYAVHWRFGIGYIYFIMNALVHSFMYFYYFLTSIGIRPSWARALTIAQISQMVIGTGLNIYWLYMYINNIPCSCRRPNLLLMSCAVMYGSYLWLFMDFFVRKYIYRTTSSEKRKNADPITQNTAKDSLKQD